MKEIDKENNDSVVCYQHELCSSTVHAFFVKQILIRSVAYITEL